MFNKEFNLSRVEEFKDLISQHLDSKCLVVTDNMRSVLSLSENSDETDQILRGSEPIELIEGAFFLQFNKRCVTTVAETLVRHCSKDTFQVLYRVFPDHARCMNDNYCMHALNFLIHLNRENANVNWLPSWLSNRNDVEGAVRSFVANCLSHFATDPIRRNILLCASGLRRLAKLLTVVDERLWSEGEVQHVLGRYMEPEDSWAQVLSSPERHNLLMLDRRANVAVAQLVRECSDSRGCPQPRTVEIRLRDIWRAEATILASAQPYQDLLKERDIGETHPTEATDVIYDSLGHGVLCMLNCHDNWKNYVLEHHHAHVEQLAQIGSWQARKWLGFEIESPLPRPPDQELANRFFLGDVTTFNMVRSGYGFS